jgi:RNA polymerase sigma-70 factor (ECF subfamily)
MHEPPRDERAESFVRLLVQHQVQIFNCILTMLPRWSDCEEVYQECSMVLWRQFDQFIPGTDFAKWACHVAYLTVLNYRRKQHREPHYFSDEFLELLAARREGQSDTLDGHRAALDHCLKKLTSSEREVLIQRYAGHKSIRALATESGGTAKSYYRLLDRVRKQLLKCIRRINTGDVSGSE